MKQLRSPLIILLLLVTILSVGYAYAKLGDQGSTTVKGKVGEPTKTPTMIVPIPEKPTATKATIDPTATGTPKNLPTLVATQEATPTTQLPTSTVNPPPTLEAKPIPTSTPIPPTDIPYPPPPPKVEPTAYPAP